MDRSPLFSKSVSGLKKDPRTRRNTQSLLTEATVAPPIGYESKGRITVLVDPPLEVRNGKIVVNMKLLKKMLAEV